MSAGATRAMDLAKEYKQGLPLCLRNMKGLASEKGKVIKIEMIELVLCSQCRTSQTIMTPLDNTLTAF